MTLMPTDPRPTDREHDKRAKRLRRLVGQAIADYAMIEHGDRVMVCLSGGKDSYAMLEILRALQAKAPVSFELVAVHLDQKQPGYDPTVLPAYLDQLGIEYHILEQDTYSVVQRVVPEGKTYCGLCSRLRRGALYAFAEQNGFSKIALGHHRDDIVQTLFLNMFHGSRIAAMPPKLQSDDGRNIVIRPLAYVSEADLIEHAVAVGYPIMPCNLCGSQDNLQRQAISAMLRDWERRHPGRIENVFRAMQHIRPSQMADRELFDFAGLGRSENVSPTTASDWLLGKPVPVEGVLA
jgi:tRNA 2-thiocytidine biosynthesis protein TtcA